eukprot:CAMPEP_0183290982 /NCGR_PEP_ID=MMETSP0160_2-20130417/549_1 /TAXON_ID=2839 ORGANISM="Odontella Sinensis, Strain Grunow 1884" /NCGR_SAMPLE_ID=MMETSP0160_2 /ASSEMBLY_ACC=CAM_ASM_000250 /LENGTH=62 /DNA_ID=CAMNT_0025451719 /DNA_START=444 /DNA_END=628 /DNA_ORIENTATION=-
MGVGPGGVGAGSGGLGIVGASEAEGGQAGATHVPAGQPSPILSYPVQENESWWMQLVEGDAS